MRAIYAFSGDPITAGHIDIVERAARTYSELLVAIGENPAKTGNYLFEADQRLAFAKSALAHLPNVSCTLFSGLLAEFAYRHGFDVIVRGVRNEGDLGDELTLYAVNRSLHSSVDTVFLPARPDLGHISSGVVKAIVKEGGDASAFCPLQVKQALEERLLQRRLIGIAGGIGAGKTRIANRLVEELLPGTPAVTVNLDHVGHYVLSNSEEPIYRATRERIAKHFGAHLQAADSAIDRRALGGIVFADGKALRELNSIMHEPMVARLYDETLRLGGGAIIIEGAILVEAGWTRIVNNNVVLVDAPVPVRIQRIMARDGIDEVEARHRIDRQSPAAERRDLLGGQIQRDHWGQIWEIDGENPDLEPVLASLRQN
jgi:pantetheine-phosphate adenylyltransferase